MLSITTENTGTPLMRGATLGTRSSGVLIAVVFTSTFFFFGAVGRFTTLYSQQTEGVVGSCAAELPQEEMRVRYVRLTLCL